MDITFKEGLELFKAVQGLTQTDEADEAYGDHIEEIDPDDALPFGEMMESQVDTWQDIPEMPEHVYGDHARNVRASDENFGGIMDDARRMVVSTVRGAVNRLTGDINGKIRGVNNRVVNNSRRLNGHDAQLRRIRSVVNKQTRVVRKSTRNLFINAALAAASGLPGIKAYSWETGETQQAEFKSRADVAKSLETLTIPTKLEQDPLTDQPVTPTQATLNASFDKLEDQQGEIITAINQLFTELEEVKAKAETHAADVDKVAALKVKNTIIDLAKLVPSQLSNEKQALYETAMKFFFGGSGTTGTGISINASL